MRKYILSLLLLTGMLLTLSSCSWFHGDESGKLGGYWHLTRIDTLATGGYADLHEAPLFYAVEGGILEVRNVDKNEFLMFRYNHVGNTLSLYDARYNDRNISDAAIDAVEVLRPYGINKLEESFIVEELNGNHLVLRSDLLKLYFDKF